MEPVGTHRQRSSPAACRTQCSHHPRQKHPWGRAARSRRQARQHQPDGRFSGGVARRPPDLGNNEARHAPATARTAPCATPAHQGPNQACGRPWAAAMQGTDKSRRAQPTTLAAQRPPPVGAGPAVGHQIVCHRVWRFKRPDTAAIKQPHRLPAARVPPSDRGRRPANSTPEKTSRTIRSVLAPAAGVVALSAVRGLGGGRPPHGGGALATAARAVVPPSWLEHHSEER